MSNKDSINIPLTTAGFELTNHNPGPKNKIPNSTGIAYKIEQVLFRDPELGTIKENVWLLPDIERGGEAGKKPHNHPWDFQSEILDGEITERRFWKEEGLIKSEERTYLTGDIYYLPRDEYHLVIDVKPGTHTKMTCGRASEGNEWGYLNLETGEHETAKPDPNFLEKFKVLNPHLK